MNLDALAGRAASSLLESTQVDTDVALDALRRLDARRTIRRRATAASAALVAVAAVGITMLPVGSRDDRQDPLPAPSFAPLGDEYDVIASETSPTGTSQVVATARDGQPDVVLVRTTDADSVDIAWSAPPAQYLGGRNAPRPAAVAWAADGSRVAIVVALERGRADDVPDLVDLTLLTVNPDGTERRTVARIGSCACTDALPTLTWSHDQVEVDIPDGPDAGHYTKEMP